MKGVRHYRNIRTQLTIGDTVRTFDSKGEAKRYAFLHKKEKEGEISNLRAQVKYPFSLKGHGLITTYIADFVYTLPSGEEIVEDYKSEVTITKVFLVKKLLMQSIYGIDVKIVLNSIKWDYAK